MHDQEGLTAVERAPIDRLLARLLLQEPDPALNELLALPAAQAAGFEPVELEPAREEFARLFLLPGGAPPFASAWLEGERERLGAQLTGFVSDALAALGREPVRREPWGNLPLDHLGLLLELSASAHSSDDPADRALGEQILTEAVRPWIAAFARVLVEKARLPLYSTLGALLLHLHGGPQSQ